MSTSFVHDTHGVQFEISPEDHELLRGNWDSVAYASSISGIGPKIRSLLCTKYSDTIELIRIAFEVKWRPNAFQKKVNIGGFGLTKAVKLMQVLSYLVTDVPVVHEMFIFAPT